MGGEQVGEFCFPTKPPLLLPLVVGIGVPHYPSFLPLIPISSDPDNYEQEAEGLVTPGDSESPNSPLDLLLYHSSSREWHLVNTPWEWKAKLPLRRGWPLYFLEGMKILVPFLALSETAV